ncbi:hypothetical protein [Methylophaga sp.]|uniref:hypothetical protein n=1 Tax=Methylophaga sp. TaxID=2024840 RepID=UPI003F696E9E
MHKGKIFAGVLVVSLAAGFAYNYALAEKNRIATRAVDDFISDLNELDPNFELFYDDINTSLFNNKIHIDGMTATVTLPEMREAGLPAKIYEVEQVVMDYSVDHSEIKSLKERSRFPEMVKIEVTGVDLGYKSDIELLKTIAEAEADVDLMILAKTLEKVAGEQPVIMDTTIDTYYDDKSGYHENMISVELRDIAEFSTHMSLSGFDYNPDGGYVSYDLTRLSVNNWLTSLKTHKNIKSAFVNAAAEVVGESESEIEVQINQAFSDMIADMKQAGVNALAPGLIDALTGYYQGGNAFTIELTSKSDKGISPFEMFIKIGMSNNEEKALMDLKKAVEVSYTGS